MTKEPRIKKPREPFINRLTGSLIIFLILAFLLGLGWVMLFWISLLLTPSDSYDEYLRTQNLPPRETLVVTQGRVLSFSRFSGPKIATVKPHVEYKVGDSMYRTTTINRYAEHLISFKATETVEVFYLPENPEKSWLKWEYERLIDAYESAVSTPFIVRVQTFYNYFALGLSGLIGLLLTVNLFFPLSRSVKFSSNKA